MYIFIPVLSTASLVLLTSYLVFRKLFVNKRVTPDNPLKGLDGNLDQIKTLRRKTIEAAMALPFESVSITAKDGKSLHGRYYHNKENAPVAILFHGYKSIGIRDFCVLTQELLSLGLNIIIPDHRSHNESDGNIITFGVKERFDAVSWCEYAMTKFGKDTKIILGGMSMGGASVLMASELGLPRNVRGIIADCPYSSPRAIIKKVLHDRGRISACLYPFVRLGAVIFGGFDPNSASAEKAVSCTDIPILILHGEADKLVPIEMSESVEKSGKTVTLIRFKEATHCTAAFYDRQLYVDSVRKFLDSTIFNNER